MLGAYTFCTVRGICCTAAWYVVQRLLHAFYCMAWQAWQGGPRHNNTAYRPGRKPSAVMETRLQGIVC
jgi:hypothetical protein